MKFIIKYKSIILFYVMVICFTCYISYTNNREQKIMGQHENYQPVYTQNMKSIGNC